MGKIPDRPHAPDLTASIFGDGVAAIAVAGLVGDDPPCSVAWVDLSRSRGRNLARFRFAIDMERSYADAYCAFSEEDYIPVYGRAMDIDLLALAKVLDVDRILCVVAMTEGSEVLGQRDYSELDLAYVVTVVQEFDRIGHSLIQYGPTAGEPRRLN